MQRQGREACKWENIASLVLQQFNNRGDIGDITGASTTNMNISSKKIKPFLFYKKHLCEGLKKGELIPGNFDPLHFLDLSTLPKCQL